MQGHSRGPSWSQEQGTEGRGGPGMGRSVSPPGKGADPSALGSASCSCLWAAVPKGILGFRRNQGALSLPEPGAVFLVLHKPTDQPCPAPCWLASVCLAHKGPGRNAPNHSRSL